MEDARHGTRTTTNGRWMKIQAGGLRSTDRELQKTTPKKYQPTPIYFLHPFFFFPPPRPPPPAPSPALSGSGVFGAYVRVWATPSSSLTLLPCRQCPIGSVLLNGGGRTLGFVLAKGLIRGLTRCPNPPTRFHSTTHFLMDVGESVRCLTIDTLRALDPVQMRVIWGGSFRRGSAPYSILS